MKRGERSRLPVLLNQDEKRCLRCGVTKPLEEFTADSRRGRGPYCRPCDRERSGAYYAANRERVLAKAAAKRGRPRVRHCSECGELLQGVQRVTCGSSRCRERRFRRLHPESYAAREAARVVRRRERRRRLREIERLDESSQKQARVQEPSGEDRT